MQMIVSVRKIISNKIRNPIQLVYWEHHIGPNWAHLRSPLNSSYLKLGSEFRVETLQFTSFPETSSWIQSSQFTLSFSEIENVGERGRRASGGDTGDFHGFFHRWGTSFLFICSESYRKSKKILNCVFVIVVVVFMFCYFILVVKVWMSTKLAQTVILIICKYY